MSTEDLEAELPQGDDNAPSEDGRMERENCDSPVPRKMLKTVKPRVFLEGKELWNCFYRLGTEMIITIKKMSQMEKYLKDQAQNAAQ